jgi:hypothetical protein
MRAVLETTLVEPHSGVQPKGGILALLADMRIGLKWLEESATNYGPKCLIVEVP